MIVGFSLSLASNQAAHAGGGFPELLLNGTFDDTSVWTLVAGSITGGQWQTGGLPAGDCIKQPVTYILGATYRFTCDYTMVSGAKLRINQSSTNGAAVPTGGTTPTLSTSGGSITLDFTATVSGSAWLHIEPDTSGFQGTLDNCSLKQTS